MKDPGALIKNKVFSNWKRFGTILKSAIYTRLGESKYDVDSGVVTPDPISTTDVKIIIDSSFEEVDNESYRKGDIQMLLPSLFLNFKAKRKDTITVDTINYIVVDFSIDPADALYIFHMREDV
jgi:transposase